MNRSLFAAAVLVCASPSYAAPIQLLLEADENRQAGSEVFMTTFDTMPDFLNGTLSTGTFSQLNIGSGFNAAGLTHDGSAYHLLLESNENRQGGSELFVGSFDSYDDLLAGSLSAGTFSQLNIGASFNAGGFTYDGSAYRLLLESNDNRQAGAEVYLASFDTFDGLLAGSSSSGQFSQLNVGADFSAGGLAYDGSSYQVLLESDANRQGGSEVFLTTFDSFDALLGGTLSDGAFSQLNVGASFSVGGFTYEYAANDPVAASDPGALSLLAMGFVGLVFVRRNRAVANSAR